MKGGDRLKKLLTLASMGCLLALGAVAHSQVIICEWEVPFSKDINGNPVQGASGSYHAVLVQLSGNSYEVAAYANNDGTAATSATAGTPAPPGVTPKSGVGKLSFNFTAVGGGLITTTTAGTSSGNTANTPYLYGGFPNNFGGPNNVSFGTAAGTVASGGWTQSGGATLFFNAFDETFFVVPHAQVTHNANGTVYNQAAGGNVFTGFFTLDPTKTLASVAASFQDSGQQYTGACGIVPEGNALAMALPGLLPLGMILRRRRAAKTA